MWVPRVLGDDHYKRLSRVTVGVARWRTPTAQWVWVPSIGQNLQSFTDNRGVSVWVKYSLVGRKTIKRTTNKKINRDKKTHKKQQQKTEQTCLRELQRLVEFRGTRRLKVENGPIRTTCKATFQKCVISRIIYVLYVIIVCIIVFLLKCFAFNPQNVWTEKKINNCHRLKVNNSFGLFCLVLRSDRQYQLSNQFHLYRMT